MGTGAGLALGLLLAGAYELPRFFKIQNVEDAKHYTGLPVLASVPPFLTGQEIASNNRRYWMNVIAGTAAAVVSVPIVVIALQASKIFER